MVDIVEDIKENIEEVGEAVEEVVEDLVEKAEKESLDTEKETPEKKIKEKTLEEKKKELLEKVKKLSGKIDVTKTEDLKEKITGDTSGKNLNDEKRKMWDNFDLKLPGGESISEASKRALSVLTLIKNELDEDGCAAVQSHGTLIGIILHHFDPSFGFDEWKNMTMPDIYKIDYGNDNTTVKHIGCDSIETFKIGN